MARKQDREKEGRKEKGRGRKERREDRKARWKRDRKKVQWNVSGRPKDSHRVVS